MIERRSVRAAVFAAAFVLGATNTSNGWAESTAWFDATDPSTTTTRCTDNSDCLSDQSCSLGVCVACGVPAARCTTTAECGPSCLGVVCVEGRCVRASSPREDLDAGSADAAFDAGALRFAGRMPTEPGCGAARVAPAHDSDQHGAIIATLSGLALIVTSEARRRRGAR